MRNERDGRGPDPRDEKHDESRNRDAADGRPIEGHRENPIDALLERNGGDADPDRRIEDLFAASRREHAEAAPGFHETLRAERPARRWAIRPAFVAATAATCMGVAAVAVAFWTGMVPSPHAPPEEPGVMKDSAKAHTSIAGQENYKGKSAVLGADLSGANGGPAATGQKAQTREGFTSIGPAPLGDDPSKLVPGSNKSATKPDQFGLHSTQPSVRVGQLVAVGDLPVPGRSYQRTLNIAPGVQDSGGAATAKDGRDRGFKKTVDGISNVDPLTGTFMSNINPDAIDHIEIVGSAKPRPGGYGVGQLRSTESARAAVTVAPKGVETVTVVGNAAEYEEAEIADAVRRDVVPGKSNGPIVQGAVKPVPKVTKSDTYDTAAGNSFKAAAGFVVFDGRDTRAAAGEGKNANSYAHIQENEFLAARENPLSTFSIDVDTASYATTRLYLETGRMPPAGAVRIEELINYFPYDDPPPNGDAPFATRVEIAGCPWNTSHRLARIALKARDISRHGRPASNLVFLVDVSGSMDEPAKLPLVISSLKQLVGELDGRDKVAIVVYAGASGLVLPPTPGSDHRAILAALDRLHAGGGTNGGEGLLLAYRTARAGFIPGGANRVILATDGDFNLGVTDRTDLLGMIGRESGGGIFLTALGFGMGNYKDDFMETLADKGNGNYAYIDSPREARKVLVEGMGGTLVTVAKDVKIQVEFNPARVGAYRLIGYENRLLAKEDFNDDTKDAGEIGAGHSVTALYELVPAGAAELSRTVDPLKYQKAPASAASAATGAGAAPGAPAAAPADEGLIASDETMTVKLRYKEPEGKESKLLEVPVVDSGLSVRAASADFKFAASVAIFGMNLRGSKFRGDATLEYAQELATEGTARDPGGYRADFQRLVKTAASLRRGAPTVDPTTP